MNLSEHQRPAERDKDRGLPFEAFHNGFYGERGSSGTPATAATAGFCLPRGKHAFFLTSGLGWLQKTWRNFEVLILNMLFDLLGTFRFVDTFSSDSLNVVYSAV